MPDWCVYCQSNPSTCPVHGTARGSSPPPGDSSRFPRGTPGPGRKACGSCSGTGQVIRYRDGVTIRCPVCLGDGYVSDNPMCDVCGEKLASWATVAEHLLKDHPSKEFDQAVAEDSPEDKYAVGLDLPEEQSADSRQVGNEPETRALAEAAEWGEPTAASNSPGESSKPQDADVVALEQARNVVISRQKFVLGTCILGLFLLGVLLLIPPANDYLFVEIFRLLYPHNPFFETSYRQWWQQWIPVVGIVFVFLSSAIVSYPLIPQPWQSP